MDNNVPVQAMDWKNTKEAVSNFRRLLLCSKCLDIMTEPVCLGMCEHLLCRPCAGSRVGDGCVVCHSPAWVKDIQINRQLSSITQLFCGLESLLNPKEQSGSPLAEIQAQTENSVIKHKKNFKIWLSPRSRKVRCVVEKPSEVTVTDSRSSGETAAAQPDAVAAQCKDLSVFNFTSSSQDSGSDSCSQKCHTNNRNKKNTLIKKNAANRKASKQGTTRTTPKQTKKKMLEAINQQWGITDGIHALTEQEQPCAEGARRSSKRVSFLSPAVTSDEPQLEVSKGSPNELCLSSGRSNMRDSPSGGSIIVLNNQAQLCENMSNSVIQHDTLSANDPIMTADLEKQDNESPHSSKRSRVEEKVITLETTPKRPRVSPGRRRKSPGQKSPAVLNPRSLISPRREKNAITPRKEQEESPSVSAIAGRKSPSTPTSVGRPTTGSPAVMKRNHKGETPLHLAAIKGDVEAVKELLDQGADPNLKDNAGWTPLHEACNLGHLGVAEVLVSRGALLNTPGYENDSPLHDAVRNRHPAIAKLLLQLGALQNVLNLHGKRPADYAVSPEMLEIFQEASEGTRNDKTSLSPSAGLSVGNDCVRRDESIVLLTSKLSQEKQHQLVKLGQLLGGRMTDTFSGSVSHVVVPEGPMPTTYSSLLGLLSGCWVVKYSWVVACLQAGKWIPETEHEAGEGPQRSRINRCSLLPPLFDGCFFFLLGTFNMPTKDELTKLLREGGGKLLSRQPKPDSDVTQTLNAAAYHALPGSDQALCTQYIIFDPQGPHKPAVVRRGKVWSAPSTWLIDCIAAFCLLPVPDPQTLV